LKGEKLMADKPALPPKSEGESKDLQESAVFQDTMNRFMDTAKVEAVYAAPLQVGEQVIIPTAEIMCAMGFGYGSGNWSPPDEEEQKKPAAAVSAGKSAPPAGGEGRGGGGGGYTFSRPVALVIATPEGVRVEPVIDRTKIWLAAFTAAGFMVGMAARMLKR
jgi:uncharacterized spore protein YtfJ